MKKIFLVFLIALAGFLFFDNALAQENLLDNPGFEDGLGNWDDLYGLPSDQSDIARTGDFSATKVVDDVLIETQDYWSEIIQDVDTAAGQPVYAGMYIKTDFLPEASARAGIMLQFLNSNDDPIMGGTFKSNVFGGNTNWRIVEIGVPAAPAGTVKARISGFLWSAKRDTLSLVGQAYYDDAFVINVNHPVPLQSTILNPGFENGLIDWEDIYGYPATISKLPVRTGAYAAKKTINPIPAKKDYWSQTFQDLACAGGKKLTVSAYINTEFVKNTTSRAGFMLEFYDANGKLISKYTDKIGYTVNTWRFLLRKVKKTPSRTARVRFSLTVYAPDARKMAAKSAYFDDVSLLIQ